MASAKSIMLLVVRVLFTATNNQYVLPNAIILLSTVACGVDLVYWILWLVLGKLVLVGHFKVTYGMSLTEPVNTHCERSP